MDIRIKGINVDLSPTIKDYAVEKIGKLDRFLENQIMSAEARLEEVKNPRVAQGQKIEVTLFTKGHMIRAKETAIDMHASIDGVVDKLERQIDKYKEKMYRSSTSRHTNDHKVQEATRAAAGAEPEPEIVRLKRVPMKPMTPSEAALQMDLLGHHFFVFINADSDEINVVYKRQDENYGLIEPV